MKTRFVSLMLIITCIISCKKDQRPFSEKSVSETNDSSKALLLQQVKEWYSSHVSAVANLQDQATKKTFALSTLTISWDKIESLNNEKGNYWIVSIPGQPTFQNVKQGYRKLAFFRDSSGTIQARILEIVPDVLYIQRKQIASTSDFTGRIFIYDQAYKLLGGEVLADGKIIGKIRPSVANTPTQSPVLRTEMMKAYFDCTWIDQNYVDAEDRLTVFSQKICTDVVYDDGNAEPNNSFDGGRGNYLGHAGGGGGDVRSAPSVVNLPGEDHTKVNPKQFMDCFGNVSNTGATMKVTVYVQEPFPGTSFAVGPNSVGHVAIGLTKSNGSASITQVVGFYPDATGLAKLNAPSKIVNNGGDLDYNVSITYTVSADQFNQITNYISNPPSTYDITTSNCTNFVYDACQAGGITLPNPYSTSGSNTMTMPMTYISGMTPGNLGSSIENLKGASNVNTTGGTTPNSKGPCK